MKRILICTIFSLSLVLGVSGCKSPQKRQQEKNKEFGYQHLIGVTGINTVLHFDGKKVPVQFSTKSDSLALMALRSLDWNIIYANANGENIVLFGELDSQIVITPACETCPQSEEYREFTLQHWYIKTPFRYFYTDDPMEPSKELVKRSLAEAGYTTFSFKGKDVSYEKFERQ